MVLDLVIVRSNDLHRKILNDDNFSNFRILS